MVYLYYHSILIFVQLVPQPDEIVGNAIEKINALLESFLGISDDELGMC